MCESQVSLYKITFIPSSTVTEVSDDEEDSIDITPSGPILSIASAIKFPIYSSFPADNEATAAERCKNQRCIIDLFIELNGEKERNQTFNVITSFYSITFLLQTFDQFF